MRITVLGGDGYGGWGTALYLSRQGHDVAIVDSSSNSSPCSNSPGLCRPRAPTSASTSESSTFRIRCRAGRALLQCEALEAARPRARAALPVGIAARFVDEHRDAYRERVDTLFMPRVDWRRTRNDRRGPAVDKETERWKAGASS